MKNCLEKEILFDFYHNALEKDQMLKISKHIEHCSNCKITLDLISMDVKIIKESLDLINPDIHEIPKFKESEFHFEEKRKFKLRRSLSWAAAFLLLISISTMTTIKIIHKQKPVNDYEYLVYIPDMNDAWKKQTIAVTSYDKNGIPIDHQIIENKN